MFFSKTRQILQSIHWNNWFFLLCILVITITVFQSFIRPLGQYDEGFALTNAWRILNGEIPHRDYWAAYPPGAAYVSAMLFALLEPSLLVARLLNMAWTLLLLGSFFILHKQFSTVLVSIGVTAIASIWIGASLYPSYSVLPALALIFLALAILFKGIKSNNHYLAILSGFVAGLVIVFRHDFSGYLFLSVCSSIAITWLFFPGLRQKPEFRGISLFALSFIVVAVLAFFSLLLLVGWGNFFEQAIFFPATGMRENRFLPFPGFLDFFWAWKERWFLAWTVPAFIAGGLAYTLFNKPNPTATQLIAIVIFIAMSIFLTIQAHNRLDMPHAAPSMLFCLSFITLLTAVKTSTNIIFGRTIGWSLLALFCFYSVITTIQGIDSKKALRCIANPHNLPCIPANKPQSEVVNYINNNHPKNSYIFVGNSRHDKIFINDASLYFILQRPIPVMWNEMHPGIVTSQPIQDEIIKQLEAKNVQLVVVADMPEPKEKNSSSISSEIHSLDVYINQNYRPVFSNDKYTVMQRSKLNEFGPIQH